MQRFPPIVKKIFVLILSVLFITVNTPSANAGTTIVATPVAGGIIATGGTITTVYQNGTIYRVHTFTSDGTFRVLSGHGQLWYLVVAGGGGGGDSTTSNNTGGGGGGAGGVRNNNGYTYSVASGSYTVTVGGGGAAETNGSDSTFDTVTATGGGHGTGITLTGSSGGSGGAGGFTGSSCGPSGGFGTGASGQGNDGTRGYTDCFTYAVGGGGGGGGSAGVAGAAGVAGVGGTGTTTTITGTSATYAGGGGGGGDTRGIAPPGASGGAGGGGAGGTNTDGSAGTANTGGGGGGAGQWVHSGGAGGSGVVIVRYAIGSVHQNTAPKIRAGSGLVGLWSFDGADVSGTTAYDRSGQGNNGTLANSPTRSIGKIGQSLSFNGSTQFVALSSALTSSNAPVTASAWVKTNAIGADQYIVDESNSGGFGGGLSMRIRSTGVVRFWQQDASSVLVDSNTTLVAGRWYHLVGTYDGITARLYINGVQDNSTVSAIVNPRNAANPSIGKSVLFGGPFNGSIDDVRIYTRALSATEVLTLYNAGTATKMNVAPTTKSATNGLIGLWSFDGPDMAGTTAYDRSGQGNNGTLTGGPTRIIGKIGQALSFNGTSDYINLPTVSGFGSFVNNGIYSVSVWAKTNTIARQAILADWSSGGGVESFALEFGGFGIADNHISTDLGTPGTYLDSNFVYSTNTWYHIVVTRSATTQSIYVNGILRNTRASAVVSNGINLTFGRGGDYNGIYLNGTMDDVRIYNRALSASEIKALYNFGK